MGKFKFQPTTSESGCFTSKVKGAVTDNDIGKGFKLSTDTTDTYEICADGDPVEAFLVAVAPATSDGLVLVTLQPEGRKRCQADGASNVGAFVEMAAQAAVGTAEENKLPKISTRAVVAAGEPLWRIISANTTDGTVADGDTTVIVERV